MKEWGLQIATALKHLHDNMMCHRDIKSDNILVVSSERVDHPVMKIADLGQSVMTTRRRLMWGGTFGYQEPSLRVMYDGVNDNIENVDQSES